MITLNQTRSIVLLRIQVVLFVSLFLSAPFAWGDGENAIHLPPLSTDAQKFEFLFEVRKHIPNLFITKYEVDHLELLNDEEKLLTQLKVNNQYLAAFKNKHFFEMDVHPPEEGLRVGEVKIKDAFVKKWTTHLKENYDRFIETWFDDNSSEGHSPLSSVDLKIAELSDALRSLLIKKIELEKKDLKKESPSLQNELKSLSKILSEFDQNPKESLTQQEKQHNLNVRRQAIQGKTDLDSKIEALLSSYSQLIKMPPDFYQKLLMTRSILEIEKALTQLVELRVALSSAPHPIHTWDDAEARVESLAEEDLIYLNDQKDALEPEVRKIKTLNPDFQARILERVYNEGIHPFAKETVQEQELVRNSIQLTQVPPAVGIFRGCTAGDCSTSRSFPYPNDPNEHIFFIKDQAGQLKGYVSATTVLSEDVPSLYVNTISGSRVSAGDTELILRALHQEKERLGVKQVLLPRLENLPSLINYLEPRGVYSRYVAGQEPIQIDYLNPQIRNNIESFESQNSYNDGKYDHAINNRFGVRFELPKRSKALQVSTRELQLKAIDPKPLSQISDSELIVFILELHQSKMDHVKEKLLNTPEVKARINSTYLSELFQTLEDCRGKEQSRLLSVKEFKNTLEEQAQKVSKNMDFLKQNSSLIYPGIIRCSDAFSNENANEISGWIVNDIQNNKRNGYSPRHVSLSAILTHKHILYQTEPFQKFFENFRSALKGLKRNLKQEEVGEWVKVFTTLEKFKPTHSLIHQDLTRFIGHDNSTIRGAAFRALAATGSRDPKIHSKLAELLKNKDLYLRTQVIETLHALRAENPAIHDELVTLIDDPLTQGAAINALADLSPNHPKFIEHLVKLTQDSRSPSFRNAISTLRKIKPKDPEVHQQLAELLNPSDPDSILISKLDLLKILEPQDSLIHERIATYLDSPHLSAIQSVLSALDAMKPTSPKVIEKLKEFAANPKTRSDLKAHTFIILNEITPLDVHFQMELVKLLKDSNPSIREKSTSLLIRNPPSQPQVFVKLGSLLRKSSDQDARLRAISVLQHTQKMTPEIKDALTSVLKDSNPHVSQAANAALIKMNEISPDLIQSLISSLESPVMKTQLDAIIKIKQSKLNDPIIQQKLTELLEKSNQLLLTRATKLALLELKPTDTTIIQDWVKLLTSSNFLARTAAVDLLIGLESLDLGVYTQIFHLLNSDDPEVRKSAAQVLKRTRWNEEITKEPRLNDLKDYLETDECSRPIHQFFETQHYQEMIELLKKLNLHLE